MAKGGLQTRSVAIGHLVLFCREPVQFFGEPGIEKVNYAALAHFGSVWRHEPLALVDCSRLDGDAVEVFGRGSKKGLLELIGSGTLLLSNAHQVFKNLFYLDKEP